LLGFAIISTIYASASIPDGHRQPLDNFPCRKRQALNRSSPTIAPAAQRGKAQADLTVVGAAGHVDIPLMLAFAEAGLTVNVNDLKGKPVVDVWGFLKNANVVY
jgi:hypothetical protein